MRRCKLICRWVLISQIMVMVFLALPVKAVNASGLVYISEIAWAGSSLSSADEWIELVNPTDVDAELSNWKLTGAGSSGRDIIFPSGTLIPANGALLVANYSIEDDKAAFNVTPGIVTSTVSLSNSKMLIQLFDAEGVLVDQAGDGSAPFAGFSDETKASMIRTDAELLGDSDVVWMTCEMAENMQTDDCGTPGMVSIVTYEGILNQVRDDESPVPGEEATSTEAVATSTEAFAIATSTFITVTTTEPLDELATSTEMLATSTEPLASTYTVMSEPAAEQPKSSFQMETVIRFLRMNEVMAAPDGGKEWVELVNLAADRTIVLDGLEVHDSVSRAIKLTGELKPQEKYKVFELPTSKLNNGGDSVYLQTSDGIVIDSLTYAGHDKGTLLARDEKLAWQYTQFSTPGGTNVIRIFDNEDEGLMIKDEDEKEEEKIIFAAVTSTSITIVATTTSVATTQPVDYEASKANQNLLRLNELMPNPADGKEWVEITSYSTSTVSLTGLELHDAAGRLKKLEGEIGTGLVLAFELNSARLNNGGDTVYLQKLDGEVIDELSYEGSQKGWSFSRMEDGTWKEVLKPTKGKPNFKIDNNDSHDEGVAISTSTLTTSKRSSSVSSGKKTSTSKNAGASSATKSELIYLIEDYSMLHQEQFGGLRVKLRGTVGTLPRQISGRGFILLNHDGRGLLVRVPSYKKIPEFGSFLTITGSLKFDTHELPYLSLTKKDGWVVEALESIDPKIRNVSMLAPQAEEAWSLVEVQGVVNDVSGSTVHLIVDDVDVDFKIKSGVAYRASRLSKGDVVRVKGVLDITDDMAVIIPRNANEIDLVSHAPESFAGTSKKEEGIPGWTPFGAAALAVGTVEGIKQIKKKVKMRAAQKPKLVKIKEPA